MVSIWVEAVNNQRIQFVDIIFSPISSGMSEGASERSNERSAARKHSEQWRACEWMSGASKWANGGAYDDMAQYSTPRFHTFFTHSVPITQTVILLCLRVSQCLWASNIFFFVVIECFSFLSPWSLGFKTRANTDHAVLRNTPKPPKMRRRNGPTDDRRTDPVIKMF